MPAFEPRRRAPGRRSKGGGGATSPETTPRPPSGARQTLPPRLCAAEGHAAARSSFSSGCSWAPASFWPGFCSSAAGRNAAAGKSSTLATERLCATGAPSTSTRRRPRRRRTPMLRLWWPRRAGRAPSARPSRPRLKFAKASPTRGRSAGSFSGTRTRATSTPSSSSPTDGRYPSRTRLTRGANGSLPAGTRESSPSEGATK